MNLNSVPVPIGFKLIGVYKLVEAGLSLAIGFGLFRLFHTDVWMSMEAIVRGLRLDPENALVHSLISRLAGIDRKQLEWLEVGTVVYAILRLIEGFGILRGKRWGGVLIILGTGSLIPVECFEIWRRRSFLRIAALVLNAAIVGYLVKNRSSLHTGRRWKRDQSKHEVKRS